MNFRYVIPLLALTSLPAFAQGECSICGDHTIKTDFFEELTKSWLGSKDLKSVKPEVVTFEYNKAISRQIIDSWGGENVKKVIVGGKEAYSFPPNYDGTLNIYTAESQEVLLKIRRAEAPPPTPLPPTPTPIPPTPTPIPPTPGPGPLVPSKDPEHGQMLVLNNLCVEPENLAAQAGKAVARACSTDGKHWLNLGRDRTDPLVFNYTTRACMSYDANQAESDITFIRCPNNEFITRILPDNRIEIYRKQANGTHNNADSRCVRPNANNTVTAGSCTSPNIIKTSPWIVAPAPKDLSFSFPYKPHPWAGIPGQLPAYEYYSYALPEGTWDFVANIQTGMSGSAYVGNDIGFFIVGASGNKDVAEKGMPVTSRVGLPAKVNRVSHVLRGRVSVSNGQITIGGKTYSGNIFTIKGGGNIGQGNTTINPNSASGQVTFTGVQ